LTKAKNRPRNDDELWEWLRDVLGLRYARRATKEGHRAPFEFVSDVYFDRVSKALVRACRGGGKTISFAAIYLLKSYFDDGYDIAHIGGTEQQAKQGYAYYAGDPDKEREPGFIRRPPFNELLASEPMVSKTTLKNGSVVEIRTGGSIKSVSGLHPIFLGIDELDHIDPSILNTALQAPMSRGQYQSRTIMGSSQYFSFGTMQMLLDSAPERGIDVYEFDLFDVMESCGRRYPHQCKGCPFYYWTNPYTGEEEELCMGRGSRSSGHYAYKDAIDKFDLTTNLEDFALQNLLMRGVSQGLVYTVFNKDRHVRQFPPEGADLSGWYCFAGVDLRTRGRIEVLAEAPGILESGKPMRWVVSEWADDNATPNKIRTAAFAMREQVREQFGLDLRVFWMEHSASDEAADWRKLGLNGHPAPPDKRNVMYGIGQIRDALHDHATGVTSLFIDPSCTDLIFSLEKGYHCKRAADGTFDRDKPDSHHEDSPDALRYAYIGGPIKMIPRLPDQAARGDWTASAGSSKWAPY
jgi:hypothetical protein